MAIFNSNITTSVEISDKYIKLIQISSKGKEIKIITGIYKEFSTSEPEVTIATLQGILKEHKIRPKDLILSVPRQSVTIKNIRLPSKIPREIDEMAGFQALKQIPYPKEEIAYGFNVIGLDPEGYSKIMLVICHQDAVKRPIEILNGCGINPAKVTLSSFGLLNWFNLNSERKKRSEASPLILVECDAANTDISIVHGGKLIYTRGLSFGSNEGNKYYERLLGEIDKTLPTYEKETQEARPTEAVFTGRITELAFSKNELERALDMKVEFVDSFSDISPSISPQFQPAASQASFSSLLGTALGTDEVDLLPKVLKSTLLARTKKRELAVSAFLMFAVIASVSFVIWTKIQQKERILHMLESKLKETTPAALEIEKMRSASDVIKSQIRKKSEPLDVLNELHKIVPPQLYLVLYTYDEEKAELKGTASVLSDVFKLVTILENSPYFQNVEVRYATKRKIGGQELVDFEIVCPLSTGAVKERK